MEKQDITKTKQDFDTKLQLDDIQYSVFKTFNER